MLSAFKNRKAKQNANKMKKLVDVEVDPVTIPELFRCPISLELMKDPVILSTGVTYDRESVEKWIFEDGKHTCPVTSVALTSLDPVPNHTIRRMIQEWCVENKAYGFDRIPTPRAPIGSSQVSEILSKIVSMRVKGNAEGVRELVGKIKDMAKESERDKKYIVLNGSARVLSETFQAFSCIDSQENTGVLEEILSGLTLILPFDQETKSGLGSNQSLRTIVKILKVGSLSGRRNAVLVLKELLSSDQTKLQEFAEIEGSIEVLTKLIKEPIDPTTTNASLLAIYHLVTPSTSFNQKETLIARFLAMGLTEKLIEMLVDCTRGVCEKALGVLEGLCSIDEGLEKAYANALTVPVLVKKLLRVSDISTEFSVSILWKLSKYEKSIGDEEGLAMEALQVGAFQKLVLLLQVGSSLHTKEKAGDLLKGWNLLRGRVECIESMDFKNLKRSF
ncbi:putative U box domain, armadillo-like helical, Zinc finger, RING/FYVE/PHD-type [Helianthus annuus]|nr:putative U box domain, armadillo-like helical, Zinc finger, RING/FYVE/PHD-type [Helianthus annuus]KAJ0866052.1 putative U box domain, armadillo-like helical, Zinc finger, RING/FYVE/PHD-type [Helianthus annuus]